MYEKLVAFAAEHLELDMEDQKIATFQDLADFIDAKVNE